jgi:hypothetical protein
MDVVKRFAVTPAGAHQLDDLTRACPALADGVGGMRALSCQRTLRP